MTKEEIYDEQINPLMAKIIEIRTENKIALLASFRLNAKSLHSTTALLGSDYLPSAAQLKALAILYPPPAIALAETIETLPDGSKRISIRRIS